MNERGYKVKIFSIGVGWQILPGIYHHEDVLQMLLEAKKKNNKNRIRVMVKAVDII